jgi:GDP-mannose 6-dehydrogenase
MDLNLPILNAILPSNDQQVERGIQMVIEKGRKKVGVLGFSFKAGTDDLRESPVVELIERLLGKGYDIRIYDKNVNLASLIGANRDYILNHIPHIHKMMVSSREEVIDHSDIIVVGNNDPEFQDILDRIKPDQSVIDLVRIISAQGSEGNYDGICW